MFHLHGTGALGALFFSTDVPHKAEAQGLCRRLNDIAGEFRMM
jgi:hypothetical protein